MAHTKIVYKKLGEVVRSALRRPSQISSVSTTFAKAVHFDKDLEQIRNLLQTNRTISINKDSLLANGDAHRQEDTLVQLCRSTSSSSQSMQWAVTNEKTFQASGPQLFMQLESFYLLADFRSLNGIIAVANIAFKKRVTARFPVKNWHTISEVTTEYERTREVVDRYNRFRFTIELLAQANLYIETMILYFRYKANEQEF
jgi:hypothetical protein